MKPRKPKKPALAGNLQSLRTIAGLTQFDLAAKSGVPLGTITDIEQGRRPNPTVETLASLAKVFGVTIGQLYGTETLKED